MGTKKYKCVFFDLDHTLWDYETNSEEALHDLFHRYALPDKGARHFPEFYDQFVSMNASVWDQCDRGEIDRDVIRLQRFHRVFQAVGVDNYELSLQFSADYITESPRKANLVPHALDVLNHLHGRYRMWIITNGFEEIQGTKLSSSGITHYFDNVITSARAGHKKPSREIFEFALRESGFGASESIMIGDNLLTDIAGARNAEIDQVFFNPNRVSHQESVTYEIASLQELKTIL